MGDANGRPVDCGQVFGGAFGQHGIAFGAVSRWPELPFPLVALFDQLRRMGFHLDKRLSFPVAEGQLDQQRIGPIGEGVETSRLADPLHRLPGTPQRACNPVKTIKRQFQRGQGRQRLAIACRLAASGVVERDISRPLQPLLPIVVRLPMADHVEKHAPFLIGKS